MAQTTCSETIQNDAEVLGVPFLGYQEPSGNEDLIDILTRIMLYLSKVFDIKNPSFK
jgi:hypothetical protein